MNTYEPGTVAVATVRGVKGVRVMRVESNYAPTVQWASAQGADHRMHEPREVTDVRPLVVLDPTVWNSNRPIQEWLRDAVRLLRRDHQNTMASVVEGFVDQIEAQTKPPRIPEPGAWSVVLAGLDDLEGKIEFARYGAGPYWLSVSHVARRWSDLIDPTLIRDGIES